MEINPTATEPLLDIGKTASFTTGGHLSERDSFPHLYERFSRFSSLFIDYRTGISSGDFERTESSFREKIPQFTLHRGADFITC